jgi:DNA polymerase-3 subunit alpha
LNEGQPVRIGGLIRDCKQHKSKRGEPMAFVTLEDIVDTVEVMVFPEAYATCYHLLTTPDPVIVSGTIQKGERGAKVIAEEINLIPEALQKYTQSIHATLEADSVTRPRMEELKQLLFNYHGNCPFSLTLHFTGEGEVDVDINKDFTVLPSREMADRVREIFGYDPLTFKKTTLEIKKRRKWKKQQA